jgi:5-methylcytosine-specific restriction protein B
MMELPPDTAIEMSEAAVTAEVVKTFERLFPLVTLAQNDAPLESIRRYLGTDARPPEETNPVFELDQVASAAHMARNALEQWVRAIKRKNQAILYGPPGTGKTYLAQLLAKHLIGGGDGFCDVLQFHPSYAYEDFMQGLRPKALKEGGLEYGMVPGRFKDFCERAVECKGPCVLVIDEINRANLARVFGELMYLLEYRAESVPLAGGDRFQIPSNVLIIGTMNTADRSIALVDHALRRRFAFLALYPNYDILRKYHAGSDFNADGLVGVLERLNAAINDRHYAVGVSFFLDKRIKENLQDVWQMEIEPYIEELFFDQQEKAKSFAWEKVQNEIAGP